jgi:hypothetical protein
MQGSHIPLQKQPINKSLANQFAIGFPHSKLPKQISKHKNKLQQLPQLLALQSSQQFSHIIPVKKQSQSIKE